MKPDTKQIVGDSSDRCMKVVTLHKGKRMLAANTGCIFSFLTRVDLTCMTLISEPPKAGRPDICGRFCIRLTNTHSGSRPSSTCFTMSRLEFLLGKNVKEKNICINRSKDDASDLQTSKKR